MLDPHVETPPRQTLRYCLFLILAFNSGVVESFSFSYLNNVFCGFATGTLIILGLKIVSKHAGDAIAPALVALGGFCIGSFISGQIIDRAGPNSPLVRRLQYLLLAELCFFDYWYYYSRSSWVK